MEITSLLVRNFRMIPEIQLDLSSGIQLFLGANAQGKTSLIEAIHYLSTSTSHRTRKENELIRWNQETAYLRGDVLQQDGESLRIECGLEKQRKVIKVNGNTLERVGDLYGCLRTVLFAPEDLEIVAGSPQERRRFLDMAIAQLDRSYIPLLQKYRRVLRQRNQILKYIQAKPRESASPELAAWDEPFVELAAEIMLTRHQTLCELSPLVEKDYGFLAQEGPLNITYSIRVEDDPESLKKKMRERLEHSRAAERERGITQIGPHRDDLIFQLEGHNLSQFGSQGQKRTAALALRLAEAKFAYKKVGDRPILLIDDVVYEMDNKRRARFWEALDMQGQLIVTATGREYLGVDLRPSRTFQVNNGEIHSD